MDKTRNKIFVGCLALLLVMVAGYALFSQNLTINGTAKAQGGFSVTPTCQTGIPANLVESTKSMFGTDWVDENGYYDDSCTVSGNIINYQASFKYPGARRYFVVKVTNTGSIDAIESNDYHNDTHNFCYDTNGNDKFESDECNNSIIDWTKIVDYTGFSVFAFEDNNGKLFTLDNITEENRSNFVTENGDVMLKPGFSDYYIFGFGLNREGQGAGAAKFSMKLDYSMTVSYSQPTAK